LPLWRCSRPAALPAPTTPQSPLASHPVVQKDADANADSDAPSDKKNKLTAEGRIVKGEGSQTGLSRWGDYSQMSLDPTDSCTFWYTQEYYLVTGGDWQTRIASFKFPNCS
jgi:hypothetical protein